MKCNGVDYYKPFANTGFRLSWYKCDSRRDGKYEIIGYLT